MTARPLPRLLLLLLFGLALLPAAEIRAETLPALQETPALLAKVQAGKLPAVGARIPQVPLMVDPVAESRSLGRPGGDLRLLFAKPKDLKLLYVYGYARLVRRRPDLSLAPDILERFEVEEGRIFTLHLRPGHRWSDGAPFTAEDFRYWWQEIRHDPDLGRHGLPEEMQVDGRPPVFTVIDPQIVRYEWAAPNPLFLPALARAAPLEIFAPAHYLKQYHRRFGDPTMIAAAVAEARARDWTQLHDDLNQPYDMINPDLPSLQPWILATRDVGGASRVEFTRNPYFHRIDSAGQQLPYLDRVIVTMAESRLIAAKTASGEADLQARYLGFDDIAVLKSSEHRMPIKVLLWTDGVGSALALYPNLTAADPDWRRLMQDRRFRKALSLAIDRDELNEMLYFGLGRSAQNTLLAEAQIREAAGLPPPEARFDPDAANQLLDALGCTERDARGIRLMPLAGGGSRPMELIIGAPNESPVEGDLLELISDYWAAIGIRALPRPSQREVFRDRAAAGSVAMNLFPGLQNGLATADTDPWELAPMKQEQLMWPSWGLFAESRGQQGQRPDLAEAEALLTLRDAWRRAEDDAARQQAWSRMLEIWDREVFSIGLVAGVPQIVVRHRDLRNLLDEALWSWQPGAQFGMHQLDLLYWGEPGDGPETVAGQGGGVGGGGGMPDAGPGAPGR